MQKINMSPVQALALTFALAEVLLAVGLFWAVQSHAV